MKKDWRIYVAPIAVLVPFVPVLFDAYSFHSAFIIAAVTAAAAELYVWSKLIEG